MTGNIRNWLNPANLSKFGGGDLILPTANSYTGSTQIRAGWITAQNNSSLGTMDPAQAPTIRPYTTISDGAALHLKPLDPTTSLNLINNFVVAGTGVSHNYGLINQSGAIQNIAGNNTLSGILQLNGAGGIGVEQLTPPVAGEDPSQSQLDREPLG